MSRTFRGSTSFVQRPSDTVQVSRPKGRGIYPPRFNNPSYGLVSGFAFEVLGFSHAPMVMVRIKRIYAGTAVIMKEIIARAICDDVRK